MSVKELNIGDYVKTKDGIIGKFEYAYDLHKSLDDTNNYDNEPNIKLEDYKYLISKNQIIKSSPNIIDLIEVGDYVNGHKVLEVNSSNVSIESNAIENEIWEEIEYYDIK